MEPEKLIQRLVPTLYEDDHLLAIAKPAGVDSGGLDKQTWPGMVEILPGVRGEGETLIAANRLSRYESGVLILAKSETAADAIRTAMRAMRVRQDYVAVVLGRMSRSKMTIGVEHGASAGRRTLPRKEVPARSKGKGATATVRPGAPSVPTTLTALRGGEKRTLVRIQTQVSTTHALRAQLRSVRLRLLGDMIQNQTKRPMKHAMTCLHLARIAFQHPVTRKPISIDCSPPPAFAGVVEGDADAHRPLHAALVRRMACLALPDTDTFRLLTGDVEDVRGLVAEKYGDVVVLQVLRGQNATTAMLKAYAKWYREWVGAKAVYAKSKPKPRGDEEIEEAGAVTLLLGREAPSEFVVHENGICFLVRPMETSVGLFLDHRDNRARVRELAEGKDVLNLFAYTCGFSLAAAMGGARSTTSVDLSPQHLSWGQANFALNGVDAKAHGFMASDAFDCLHQARREDRRFDLIVLDPPTFAHGRKSQRDFSIRRDLAELVRASADVLRPDGVMMVSTNLRSFPGPAIRDQVRRGAGNRRVTLIAAPPLPADFVVDPDHAKTVFLRFE